MSEQKNQKRILVVDDNQVLLDLLQAMLSASGHRVNTAVNGTEAVARLKEQPFDIVVTDFSMPGMDGWQLTRYIAVNHPEIPVVMVSGNPDAITRIHPGLTFVPHEPNGLSGTLTGNVSNSEAPFYHSVSVQAKPFQSSDLQNAIREAMANSGSSQVDHPLNGNGKRHTSLDDGIQAPAFHKCTLDGGQS